jgi:hypothetical protein
VQLQKTSANVIDMNAKISGIIVIVVINAITNKALKSSSLETV